jgi:hexosaminidase
VWPRPRTAKLGRSSLSLLHDVPLFEHHNPVHSAPLLRSAFDRAARVVFANGTALPHLRIRVPGVRESPVPFDMDNCNTDGSPPFGTLRVEIEATVSTPLQYGVDESYAIELSSTPGGGGTLRAPTEWGALRGVETFVQLVRTTPDRHPQLCGLPLSIADRPTFMWRGLLLDTSRHFLPVRSALLPMLDAMAAVKLNIFHWHLTDAAAFPLALDAEPELARGAIHPNLVYTPSELRAVVSAAQRRGIRVVPELDMPAHTASWAFGRPDLVVRCPDRVAADDEGLEHGTNKAALNPLKPETYELVERLLTELASIFPDEYVHLGSDEVDGDCWLSDPGIAAWAREYSGRSPYADWKDALVALFAKRVGRIATKLGKRVILWDDALEAVQQLPDTSTALPGSVAISDEEDGEAEAPFEREWITIDVWRDWVRTHYERRDQALLAGHRVIWSALGWYQDHAGNTWDAMYHNVHLPKPTAGLLGGETSCWNEHADAINLQERVLLRAAAVAERLWSGRPSAADVARQRLASLRCRLLRRGLRAPPVIPDHCELEDAALGSAEEPLACIDAPMPPPTPMCAPSAPQASWAHVPLGASVALNAILMLALMRLGILRRMKARSIAEPATRLKAD